MPEAPQLISAPAVTEPLGLATAVGVGVIDTSTGDPLDPSGNWKRGYQLVGEVCGVHDLYIVNPLCESDDLPPVDDFTGWEAAVPGRPFAIGAGVACSTFGSPSDIAQWQEKADRRLEVCRWSEVASELWTGAKSKTDNAGVAFNRYLMSPDATLVDDGDPLSVIGAVAELDASFRTCTCGGPRVIHAPVELVTWFKARSVIERRGERWYTPNGSLVVFDDGYPGLGPDEEAVDPEDPPTARAAPGDGQFWIYGTQPIVVKFDAVIHPNPELADAVDYQRNNWLVRSQQMAMASWLCCHLAVLVDTTVAN